MTTRPMKMSQLCWYWFMEERSVGNQHVFATLMPRTKRSCVTSISLASNALYANAQRYNLTAENYAIQDSVSVYWANIIPKDAEAKQRKLIR